MKAKETPWYMKRLHTSAADWIRSVKPTIEQAAAVLEFAYQQWLDGWGESMEKWVGLTEKEFSAWRNSGVLPKWAQRRRH